MLPCIEDVDIVDLIESKTLTGAKSLFGKDLSRLNLTLIDYNCQVLLEVNADSQYLKLVYSTKTNFNSCW
ncbi:hypothetical protein D082_20540 [Synechocystis sp. PCC 6714]|nr:hypothetical protein D082_20540 [Synechocystis sp. PCC 6714]